MFLSPIPLTDTHSCGWNRWVMEREREGMMENVRSKKRGGGGGDG